MHLPGHISASTLVDLDDDAASVVARLRRPVPREPGMSARKGTAFHAWVEEYFGTAGMLDLGEAAGADDHIDEAYGLDAMVETFRQSEWAHRAPAHVEVPGGDADRRRGGPRPHRRRLPGCRRRLGPRGLEDRPPRPRPAS